ncbi:Spo7-like protein-domain-containing protein [Gautieria morchelliformis]|nr:Spo7-like protein-domain-containing protein [Gautieria morchelliformis]
MVTTCHTRWEQKRQLMPRSTPPPQRGSFYPPNDASTYRDLLLFEERLKTNAASLKRRKSRYQLFLAQLLLVIAILLSDVLLDTSFLVLPLNFLLGRTWPDRPAIVAHQYVTSGLLFIAVTTLVLFYASGLYAEKIAYANRYVPHANRALRSFNVYLNVRSPPLRSSLNPFSYFFPRSPLTTPQQLPNAAPRASSPRRAPAIPPIPPTSNPRGELIFSSRVEPSFRESYERYRGAFERKREEQKRATRGSWFDFLSVPWRKAKQPQPQIQLQMPHGGGASLRGRTPSTTPSSSRRSSPAPGAASKGSLRRLKAGRSGTPVLEAQLTKEKESHRTESFSFLLADQETSSDP